MRNVVVIPTYNEKQHIEKLAFEILRFHPETDILFVDDSSPDGTGRVADELSERCNKIKVLHRPRKSGLGRAYFDGFKYVLSLNPPYERVIQMDADFSHHPRYLPILLEASKNKDVIIGSRYIPGGRVAGWSIDKKALSYAANLYVHLWLRLKPRDCTSGFRCFDRKVLADIQIEDIKSSGYLFQIEVLTRCLRFGHNFSEIPIVFVERKEGKSKLGFFDIWEAILGVPKLFFQHGIIYSGNNK